MSSERRRPTQEEREERYAARRLGRGGRGAGAGVGAPAPPGPFGILWEGEQPAAGGRGRGRGRGGGLSRGQIVAAALRVADAEGPEAVSMRRIATELGVGTMSLYHHVPTKDDLVDLMHDQVMGELVIPAAELADGWREALAQISRRTREVYQRHQWMVSGTWERPQMGPRAFAHVEQSLSIFAGFDLDVQRIGEILGAADDYVFGFVARETATRRWLRRAGLSLEQYREALEPHIRRLVQEGGYPSLQRFADADRRVEDTPRFEQGLGWLLDGIAASLPTLRKR